MEKAYYKSLASLVLILLLVFVLAGCGSKNNFAGKWYEIDTEPEEYIEFSKNKTGFVSSENLSFDYEPNNDEVVVTFSYGEAIKFYIVEMDGYKYLIEEGDDEPTWSNSADGAIALQTKWDTAYEENQKAYEEEQRKQEEECRKAEEEAAQKLEEEFQAAEAAMAVFNGSVLVGRDGIMQATAAIAKDGTWLLNQDADPSAIGSSHRSFEGTLIRGAVPGEFKLDVNKDSYYYEISGTRKDERENDNVPEGYYDITINLVEENGRFSDSKLAISLFVGDKVDCILEKQE